MEPKTIEIRLNIPSEYDDDDDNNNKVEFVVVVDDSRIILCVNIIETFV